ncbi:lipopolysaccharide heptosyltransferase II [Uliginosibacterium sp. H1]|uniref:lipopolysaccharide heptosyltransferase II n=1 Tax=Uliginosibacterium sp. H1 TaxID=3114757 RepID=UPI002E18777A|nr:lipopolysaccharide heptosyltransferase II [Uliginosibacterium sp. H1]
MKILVIAPSWIGDTVAAQPLFLRIRQRHPDSIIEVLAPGWVAPALQAMPEISRVIENPFNHGELKLLARWRLGRRLAKNGYAAAYVLPNSLKSALVPWFAGIPRRIGFVGEARYGLINERHVLNEDLLPLQVERYAQLAEQPGQDLERPLPYPKLKLEQKDALSALAVLGLDAEPAPVVFCPGAEYGPAKRWPEQHFASLARKLLERDIPVWILGSRKDAPVAAEIVRLAGGDSKNLRNLCGSTNLGQAISIISMARHVVTNDSGLMHVSAALDRPTVALFGSSSPNYTPPLSYKAEVIWLKLACSPCFKRECPLGHLDCLHHISPDQVFQRLVDKQVHAA